MRIVEQAPPSIPPRKSLPVKQDMLLIINKNYYNAKVPKNLPCSEFGDDHKQRMVVVHHDHVSSYLGSS